MGVCSRVVGRYGRPLCRAVRRVPLCIAVLATAGFPAPRADSGRSRSGSPAALLEMLLRDPAEALRQAGTARRTGALARATWLYGATAARHRIIADHAALLHTHLLIEQGLDGRARKAALAALARYPDSPLRPDFQRLIGDLDVRMGDEAAARAAWALALAGADDEVLRARLSFATAESLERSGAAADAAERYVELWRSLPAAPEAAVAEQRLDRLDALRAEPTRSAEDWRRRADGLYRVRSNEAALAAYDRALAGALEDDARHDAQHQRAHCLFRLRRYPEAARAFAALPPEPENRLWRARAVARSGDVSAAVRDFEKLSRSGRGEVPDRALFLAATLLEGRGHGARARAYFARVARGAATPGLERAALWRLGWSAYLRERYREAERWLERLAAATPDPVGGLRPRYWRARALERRDPGRAAAEFDSIARKFPLSYYGWRSSQRRSNAGTRSAGHHVPAGRARLSPRELARPRVLLEAGLLEQAHREVERVAPRVRGLSERLELAHLFTEAGDYHGAQRLIVDAYTEPLARGPLPSLEDLWWYAWPDAYADLVGAAIGQGAGVEPELVMAIMREESGYRPRVVSISGARGLLQIMAETGGRLARQLGREGFDPEELFVPQTNIELGTHYLRQLRNRFGERRAAAVASYNAGPNVVARWVDRRRRMTSDEWVEAIPYDQTRGYVKRVLRSEYAYRILY